MMALWGYRAGRGRLAGREGLGPGELGSAPRRGHGGLLAFWLLISVASLHAGEVVAAGFLTGVRQIASGFAGFLARF
jgi:hypothetical protein